MAKMKKKLMSDVDDRTRFYRATYKTAAGEVTHEVFVSTDISDAREFAAGKNAFGRQLMDLEEFKELLDALL